MAMDKIGDGLKKFLLVGIGAAAVTVEKSQQVIDELVKKGEITFEQGKELNKELQQNVRKTIDARKADAQTLEEKIAGMGKDELAALKEKIQEAEKAVEEAVEEDPKTKEEEEFEEDLRKEGYMPSVEEPAEDTPEAEA